MFMRYVLRHIHFVCYQVFVWMERIATHAHALMDTPEKIVVNVSASNHKSNTVHETFINVYIKFSLLCSSTATQICPSSR